MATLRLHNWASLHIVPCDCKCQNFRPGSNSGGHAGSPSEWVLMTAHCAVLGLLIGQVFLWRTGQLLFPQIYQSVIRKRVSLALRHVSIVPVHLEPSMPLVTYAPCGCKFAEDWIKWVITPPQDVVVSRMESLHLHPPIVSSSNAVKFLQMLREQVTQWFWNKFTFVWPWPGQRWDCTSSGCFGAGSQASVWAERRIVAAAVSLPLYRCPPPRSACFPPRQPSCPMQ